MAPCAERDQVLFGVVAGVTPNSCDAPHDGKVEIGPDQMIRAFFAVPVKESNGGLQFGAAQPLASNSASPQAGFYESKKF